MVEEWCGRVRGPAHPADHRPALGRRAGRRRGPPQRRARRARRLLLRDPAVPRAAVDPHRRLGPVLRRRATRPSTVINMHIGSSSKMPSTSADAPAAVGSTLTFGNACLSSMVDWLMSGVFARFPKLKIAYSEGQIGWIPYILERADMVWEENRGWGGVADKVLEPPSELLHASTSTAASSTTRTASTARRRSAWTTSPSRPTTRTPTAPGRTPARSPKSDGSPRARGDREARARQRHQTLAARQVSGELYSRSCKRDFGCAETSRCSFGPRLTARSAGLDKK